MNRREFLALAPSLALAQRGSGPSGPLTLTDVTAAAGLASFRHNSGAYGGKLLPETLGSGCAFLDYDGDGWLDIYLVNSGTSDFHTPARPLRNCLLYTSDAADE